MAKEYNITRTGGRCCACGRRMQPGEEFVATVREADGAAEEELLREDFCTACWEAAGDEARSAPAVLGTWRSRVPATKEKKRRAFVDDDLLIGFFQRIEGAREPARVQLRFVLALVLMRKKLLVYDRCDRGPDGRDVWTMHLKGEKKTCKVIDANMDEDKIAEASRQLGEILEGEL